MARYVSEGAEVVVATLTGGERGDILNPRVDTPEVAANIAEVRRAEMAEAARLLGVRHEWLGFVDSGLPEGDPLPPLPDGCFALQDVAEAAGPLVRLIREFRPHVLTTYDENGGYPHPDHIMTNRVSLAAVDAAADPDAWPEHGPAWQVRKVYYHMTFHRARMVALDEAMHEHGIPSPYADRLQSWPDDADLNARLTTFVPCGDWFDVRDDALRAHATQVDPDGFWFAVPLAIQKAAWPTEDYQLVRSAVPTRIPECDLFAGLDTHLEDRLDAWFYSI